MEIHAENSFQCLEQLLISLPSSEKRQQVKVKQFNLKSFDFNDKAQWNMQPMKSMRKLLIKGFVNRNLHCKAIQVENDNENFAA